MIECGHHTLRAYNVHCYYRQVCYNILSEFISLVNCNSNALYAHDSRVSNNNYTQVPIYVHNIIILYIITNYDSGQ